MTSLAERIAAMRKKTDTSTVSSATNSTPLEVYVRLYNKCSTLTSQGLEGSCFVNYMEGAKLLYKWLSPIEINRSIVFKASRTPDLMSSYSVGALASVISGEAYGKEYRYIHNLVVYYTAKHILEEITE